MEHVYDQVGSVQASEREKMTEISEYLEKKRTSALLAAQNAPKRKKVLPVHMANAAALSHGHDCSKNRDCNRDFRLLGCVKVYKMKTVQERCDYIKERGHCMRCGNVFKTGKSNKVSNSGQNGEGNLHKCTWYKYKTQVVRCTETYNQRPCYFGDATCLAHEEVSNVPKELLDWLKRLKVQLTVFTI